MTDSPEYGYDAVARALDIGPDSSRAERTIDITTLGARTGAPRRVEVWFHRVDGRWYITGMPVPRNWYANVRANPRFIVHLKHRVTADLPATAAPIDEPTRRRVITAVLERREGSPPPGASLHVAAVFLAGVAGCRVEAGEVVAVTVLAAP